MSDYDKMYQDQKEAGTLRHMAPRMLKLKKDEVVCGKYVGRELIKSKDSKMPDYHVYTFERVEEMVRFPVSGHFDKNMGALIKPGGVYAITFLGKQDIGKGKQFKEIDVMVLQDPPDEDNKTGVESA